MRETDLSAALREATPEPGLTDAERLDRVLSAVPARAARRRWVVGALVAAAVVVVAGLILVWQEDGGSDGVSPAGAGTTLPPGTLRCRVDGTDYYPVKGELSPGAAGVVLCERTRAGVVEAARFEGDSSSLVDLVASLPLVEDDDYYCEGGDYAYDLAFGYPDGHTEMVSLTLGGDCDDVGVNEETKVGAAALLDAFRALGPGEPSAGGTPTTAADDCEPAVDGPVVEMTIGPDIPTPLCLIAHPDQRIRVVNATDADGSSGARAVVPVDYPFLTLDVGESGKTRPIGQFYEYGLNLLDIQQYGTAEKDGRFWVVEVWVE